MEAFWSNVTDYFNEEMLTNIWTTGGRVVLIIVLTYLVYRVFRWLARYLTGQVKALDDEEDSMMDRRADTISRVASTSGVAVIIGTALIMLLQEFGINVTPVLASVGVIGLALGLGAQTLVSDVISGLFLLTENQYTIGDVISVNGTAGTVERMTLRVTFLRDLEGTLHSIPNGLIRTVANITRGWSRAVLNLLVPIETDTELLFATLDEICERLKADESGAAQNLLEDPLVTGVEGIEDGTIKVRIMVKTHPELHWATLRVMRQLVLDAFKEKGIEIAIPRQELRLVQSEA